ncbi:MAG: hypothetical protein ACXWIU_10450 [Limisphaerales bacterium]
MADVSKLNGFAVTGISDSKATISKVAAYAVAGISDQALTISKVTAYAVIDTTARTSRPQVFVCT